MKKKVIKPGRLWSLTIGVIGGFLLFLALAPVLLSSRNADTISQWRDIILQWTQFTGYLRLIFSAGALLVTGLGLIGVIINFTKPYTGQNLMLWGGIASVIFLIVLWLGLLDLHTLLGSTDIGSYLIWDNNWGIASWSVSQKVFHFFGGSWLIPAFTGSILLILTNLPRWWSRFR